MLPFTFFHTPTHVFRPYANLPNSVRRLVGSYRLVRPVTMCRQTDLPLWISSSSHLKWLLTFLKWRSLTVTLRWQSDNGTNSLQLFDFTAAGHHLRACHSSLAETQFKQCQFVFTALNQVSLSNQHSVCSKHNIVFVLEYHC